MSRRDRVLLPFEVAQVLAIAIAPLPEQLPVALPLVGIAGLSAWIRGRSLGTERSIPLAFPIGAAAGLLALIAALVVGTPLVESIADRAVQWSTYPIARGSFGQAGVVMVVVIATAVAMELALRGWIVERVIALRPRLSPNAVGVGVGAFAEAIITRGDFASRLGAAMFGAGLGWIYVASKRSIAAPVAARLVFTCGALILEALQLIG